jgi:hypothetical protein
MQTIFVVCYVCNIIASFGVQKESSKSNGLLNRIKIVKLKLCARKVGVPEDCVLVKCGKQPPNTHGCA